MQPCCQPAAPEEVDAFGSALRPYFTNEDVRDENTNRLLSTEQPVKRLRAQYQGLKASGASEDEADNVFVS